jgi:hypothetical protein
MTLHCNRIWVRSLFCIAGELFYYTVQEFFRPDVVLSEFKSSGVHLAEFPDRIGCRGKWNHAIHQKESERNASSTTTARTRSSSTTATTPNMVTFDNFALLPRFPGSHCYHVRGSHCDLIRDSHCYLVRGSHCDLVCCRLSLHCSHHSRFTFGLIQTQQHLAGTYTHAHRTHTHMISPLQLQKLLHYAILAPSSHNTQCWKFSTRSNDNEASISIRPDLSRRLSIVDPDDHHLYVSLGCAAENLVQAAPALGLSAKIDIVDDDDSASGVVVVHVALEPGPEVITSLFQAIPHRQCTRTVYDGRPLDPTELELLRVAGTGNGVRVVILTEPVALEAVLDFVVQGNTAQFQNPDFLSELKTWIRFNELEATKTGDGLWGRSMGSPPIPRWLANLLTGFLFRASTENDKAQRQIRSSAGIAIFASQVNDKRHWIEAGRCYERFALQATALGIRNAFINQPVEEAAVRPLFWTKVLDLVGEENKDLARFSRPDLVLRFGRGAEMPRSLRRPLEAVLVD